MYNGEHAPHCYTMTTIIHIRNEAGQYKNRTYTKIALQIDTNVMKTYEPFVDEIGICVVMMNDGNWWLIPNDPDYDFNWNEIGPHDTAEDAFAILKLMATASYQLPIHDKSLLDSIQAK